MLELMLCSMLTLLPDFLFRRFVQGKRLGREITLFSVWYELRWGITTCLILTVLLITVVLYNHPSSTNVTSLFRTISIFPEVGGRVSEVYVGYNEKVKKGDPLFKMDTTRQEAAVKTARAKIAEVEAAMITAKADILTSEGKLDEAKGALGQAQEMGPNHFGESTEHGFGIHQPDAAEPSGRPDTCCGRRPWCPPQVLSPVAAGLREKTKFDVAIGGVRL